MIFRLATMQDINVLIGFDTLASHDLHRHTEIREWCKAGEKEQPANKISWLF